MCEHEEARCYFVVGLEGPGYRLLSFVTEKRRVFLEGEQVGQRPLVGLPAVHADDARLRDAKQRVGQALLHEGLDVVARDADEDDRIEDFGWVFRVAELDVIGLEVVDLVPENDGLALVNLVLDRLRA